MLFTEYFKIVQERFRYFLLHYRYTGGILTVVRACPETQLDYFNYGSYAFKKVYVIKRNKTKHLVIILILFLVMAAFWQYPFILPRLL
jgi:hypothetical protein